MTPAERYPPDDNYWCCGECHRWQCADCGEWHCSWFEERCPKTGKRNMQPREGEMIEQEFVRLRIGQRVSLRRPHPHAPASGTIIAIEPLPHLPRVGKRPRLRLDDGQQCYLIWPRHAMLLKEEKESES